MKVLITGANGYLGQGITKALLENDVYVIATDITTDGLDIRANLVECDLFEVSNPFDFFCKPDVVLHLAWRDGFLHYSDAHINDLSKHYMFIKKMCEAGVRRIVGMGSMHEVGFYEGSIKEDTPCNPVTPYGISKNALRSLTAMLCAKNGKDFQWLRGFYIVGSSPNGSSVFSKIISAAIDGEKVFPFTNGQNQFDFIDYDVFCKQVSAAVMQNEVLGIINICTGHPEKISDRVERFIIENNLSIKLEYGAFADRPYDSKAVWGDNTKICECLDKLTKKD